MNDIVCIPMAEIVDTPGIFDALHCSPVRWTRALRGMLSSKGLDVGEKALIFEMRYEHECYEWWFCNASSPREAHDLFYAEVSAREDARQRRRIQEWKQEMSGKSVAGE